MQTSATLINRAAPPPPQASEIIIIPFHASGHIFPATELATLLASRNYHVTLLLPSNSSTSSSLHPLIQIIHHDHLHGPPPPPQSSLSPSQPAHAGHLPPPYPPDQAHEANARDLLSRLVNGRDATSLRLLCIIVDVMMAHMVPLCRELGVPVACLFTASACSTALDHSMSLISSPDLPAEMALMAAANLELHLGGPSPPQPHRGPPAGPSIGPQPPLSSGPPPMHPRGRGPRPPMQGHGGGPPPRTLAETEGSVALLFNTCNDLERSFLDYISKEAKKPALAVGPLLPAEFWSARAGTSSLVHDDTVRAKRNSTHSEHDVHKWLDSKPPCSVVYVCFGSLVSPSMKELVELAAGLEESGRAFIWAVQHAPMPHDPAGLPLEQRGVEAFDPEELAKRVGDRGLVVRGWAPQLLILSHPSTAGFLTHCGWNSTVEALKCGVPMLTWPIHGDQMYNSRLVTQHLRVGRTIKKDSQNSVTRKMVAEGIELLMMDGETRKRAMEVARDVFSHGFPKSSSASLDTFLDTIRYIS